MSKKFSRVFAGIMVLSVACTSWAGGTALFNANDPDGGGMQIEMVWRSASEVVLTMLEGGEQGRMIIVPEGTFVESAGQLMAMPPSARRNQSQLGAGAELISLSAPKGKAKVAGFSGQNYRIKWRDRRGTHEADAVLSKNKEIREMTEVWLGVTQRLSGQKQNHDNSIAAKLRELGLGLLSVDGAFTLAKLGNQTPPKSAFDVSSAGAAPNFGDMPDYAGLGQGAANTGMPDMNAMMQQAMKDAPPEQAALMAKIMAGQYGGADTDRSRLMSDMAKADAAEQSRREQGKQQRRERAEAEAQAKRQRAANRPPPPSNSWVTQFTRNYMAKLAASSSLAETNRYRARDGQAYSDATSGFGGGPSGPRFKAMRDKAKQCQNATVRLKTQDAAAKRDGAHAYEITGPGNSWCMFMNIVPSDDSGSSWLINFEQWAG